MFSFFKGFLRTGLIATVLIGTVAAGAALIAGPNRSHAVMEHFQDSIQSSIDDALGDPVAMRSQLQELEREYPQRIAAVRGDLAELNEQMRQLEREQAISERVVALAERDLSQFEPALNQAATAVATSGGTKRLAVAVDDKVYSYERAQSKANQIRQTRVAYANRAADARHDLTYLEQQAGRLGDLLLQLEGERAQFQTQIQALSRQVDSIARNERLIGLLEKRNRTIEECSNYDVSTLDQLTGRLSEIRSRQEAELDLLSNHQRQTDYEDMARMELNSMPPRVTIEAGEPHVTVLMPADH
jgi:chromosome segregation ATPase